MATIQARRVLAVSVATVFGASASLHAQTFYQNFDISGPSNPRPGCNIGDFPGGPGTYPFPSGWLKRNVDNRPPAPGVAYVNEAWEVREDFDINVSECAAFSTSFYSPAGQADDWMWTPVITVPVGPSTLYWRAIAYDVAFRDGYEVRVMVATNGPPTGGPGAIGNQITGSSVVFSVAAELADWTTHAVSLSAYSGQQIYLGFRNNSNDKYVLLIDDVKVLDNAPDVAATSPAFSSPYPRVAAGVAVDARLAVNAANVGGSELTNVVATATILRDGNPVGQPIISNTVASVPVGAVKPVSFPTGFTFNANGVWSIRYSLSASQSPSEINPLDNVIESVPTVIGGNEFARHALPATGYLGIGAGDGGEIGVQMEVLTTTRFEGLRFAMNAVPPAVPPDPEWAGRDIVANLRPLNTGTGQPGALLASTTPVTSTNAGVTYDAPFAGGPQQLAPGSYVITVSEPVGGPAMRLQTTTQRFEAGAGWVNWPSSPFNGWAHPEQIDIQYGVTPDVSMLSELALFRNGFEVAGSAAAPVRIAVPARPLRRAVPTRIAPQEPR